MHASGRVGNSSGPVMDGKSTEPAPPSFGIAETSGRSSMASTNTSTSGTNLLLQLGGQAGDDYDLFGGRSTQLRDHSTTTDADRMGEILHLSPETADGPPSQPYLFGLLDRAGPNEHFLPHAGTGDHSDARQPQQPCSAATAMEDATTPRVSPWSNSVFPREEPLLSFTGGPSAGSVHNSAFSAGDESLGSGSGLGGATRSPHAISSNVFDLQPPQSSRMRHTSYDSRSPPAVDYAQPHADPGWGWQLSASAVSQGPAGQLPPDPHHHHAMHDGMEQMNGGAPYRPQQQQQQLDGFRAAPGMGALPMTLGAAQGRPLPQPTSPQSGNSNSSSDLLDGIVQAGHGQYYCKLCFRFFARRTLLMDHLASNQHGIAQQHRLDFMDLSAHHISLEAFGHFHCLACNKGISGNKALVDHINSRWHRKKMGLAPLNIQIPEALRHVLGADDTGANSRGRPQDGDGGGYSHESEAGCVQLNLSSAAMSTLRTLGNRTFWCTVCNKSISGVKSVSDHVNSKRHLMKLAGQTAQPDKFVTRIDCTDHTFCCSVCNVNIMGALNVSSHVNSKKHLKKLALIQDGMLGAPDPGSYIPHHAPSQVQPLEHAAQNPMGGWVQSHGPPPPAFVLPPNAFSSLSPGYDIRAGQIPLQR